MVLYGLYPYHAHRRRSNGAICSHTLHVISSIYCPAMCGISLCALLYSISDVRHLCVHYCTARDQRCVASLCVHYCTRSAMCGISLCMCITVLDQRCAASLSARHLSVLGISLCASQYVISSPSWNFC